ncbi:MAG: hypothetical protein U1E77_10410 [Inhella sp.]
MPGPTRWIRIEAAAPPKPAVGAPCNGCGQCCLAEPCPLGVLASRRRHGECAALEWEPTQARYRCGLLRAPLAHLLGRPAKQAHALDRPLRALARRWIAAGSGCDAELETLHPNEQKAPPA